jgi:hypothetical protein
VDEGDGGGEEKSPAIAVTFSSFSFSLEEDPLEDSMLVSESQQCMPFHFSSYGTFCASHPFS